MNGSLALREFDVQVGWTRSRVWRIIGKAVKSGSRYLGFRCSNKTWLRILNRLNPTPVMVRPMNWTGKTIFAFGYPVVFDDTLPFGDIRFGEP